MRRSWWGPRTSEFFLLPLPRRRSEPHSTAISNIHRHTHNNITPRWARKGYYSSYYLSLDSSPHLWPRLFVQTIQTAHHRSRALSTDQDAVPTHTFHTLIIFFFSIYPHNGSSTAYYRLPQLAYNYKKLTELKFFAYHSTMRTQCVSTE